MASEQLERLGRSFALLKKKKSRGASAYVPLMLPICKFMRLYLLRWQHLVAYWSVSVRSSSPKASVIHLWPNSLENGVGQQHLVWDQDFSTGEHVSCHGVIMRANCTDSE